MEKDINLREDILSNQRNFLLSSIDSLTEYEEVTLEDYMKNWLPLTRALREIELSKKLQDVNQHEAPLQHRAAQNTKALNPKPRQHHNRRGSEWDRHAQVQKKPPQPHEASG